MFILVIYKDAPELSASKHSHRKANDPDISMEKTLLVNPDCPVRIMLEYIRKKCRLGVFTQFDLCDESGILLGLFNLPTYTYATTEFEHKKTYYLIVLRSEHEKSERKLSVMPQLNHDNRLYQELKNKVKRYLLSSMTSLDTHRHSAPGTPPASLALSKSAKQAATKTKTSGKK